MVYYRKYRPQNIEELDSKSVRDRLHSILESSSVSHAFLFTGPKGLGKTSTARIVAKALNCERLASSKSASSSKDKKLNAKRYTLNASVEPCNKCDQCISITNGTNMDVLEIDGASNRGIDEIRDLREKVKLSPLSASKKVYIIDEVHMLTTEAFNALLKTLEEPPSHVVFILCTTEPQKVPATILSRCLHIQFKKATREELVRSFERIIKGEKLTADKEALDLIAGLSDGSFRDGVKILEEMVSVSKNKKITKELIEEKYYVSSIKIHVSEMLSLLEKKDTKGGLTLVSKLVEQGTDMKFFIDELIQNLHSLLLQKVGIKDESEIKNLKFDINEIKRLVELLAKAESELKYAVLPQIPLELVIVEWGMLQQEVFVARQPRVSDDARLENSKPLSDFASLSKIRPQTASKPNFSSSESGLPRSSNHGINVTQQDIGKYSENDALWTALIDKVKAYNHSIAGVLRGCSIKSYDGKSLIIEAKFKFHKDKLSEPKTREILQKVSRDITKKDINVEVLLREVKT